ncbi:MAG: hypothetical protein ACRC5S_03505 [Cetobacterium sp.]|uniref:hypothetical protein n=1 Tax=Cetobacterium somerae TaxID=188913 RepID=UPI002E7ABB8C|nr:hypothetical protein [Cetobacterium somerae]WVJ03063.1 hypothetical protein VSU16_15135 [Cetobacterium somerae]
MIKMFIKLIIKLIKGKGSKLEKRLMRTEAYWDGTIEEANETQGNIESKYHKAKGIYEAKSEELSIVQRNLEEMSVSLNEAKERYKETKSEDDKIIAKATFDEYNKLLSDESILKTEVERLFKVYQDFSSIRDNAIETLNEQKQAANENKSKVEISETINDLTKGIDKIKPINEKAKFEVNSKYYENKSKLDSMSSKIPKANKTKKFEDFLNS